MRKEKLPVNMDIIAAYYHILRHRAADADAGADADADAGAGAIV